VSLYTLIAFGFILSIELHHQAVSSDSNEERLEHYYSPPLLEDENISKEGLCVRPGHTEPYDLSFERLHNKQVITISGFGGSGITVGEGAVHAQLERFESQVLPQLPYHRETEIAIIGNGVIGSLTALHLNNKGYKNILVFTDQKSASATPNAGGYIAASIADGHPEAEQYKQMCLTTFKGFSAAFEGTHPFIDAQDKDIVRRLPVYRTGGKSAALENYVAQRLMKPGINVKLHILDTEVSHNLYCYEDAMYVNPRLLLQHLHHQVTRYQIPVVDRHIGYLSEIEASVVFNCSGALAGKLTGKQGSYIPTLGHYMLLHNQPESAQGLNSSNSMIVAQGSEFAANNGHNVSMSLNLLPKTGVKEEGENYQAYLGGTFIKNVRLNRHGYVKKENHYPEAFKHILNNAREFFGLPTS
jgi:glycine/D-amino acid oxidase-like deaminating enzyme